jgi:hypothetical protein
MNYSIICKCAVDVDYLCIAWFNGKKERKKEKTSTKRKYLLNIDGFMMVK